MTKEEKFRYDPTNHTYWLGDQRLIGVSEAMESAGLKDFSRIDPEVLARAAQRGKAVHNATHFMDECDLDWTTVSPEIEPYVRAWERFKKDTGVEVLEIETPLYSWTLGFAGTPDRVVTLNGKRGIIDLKTYKPDNVTGVQLAAYSYLKFGPHPEAKRWGLWLKDDGSYRLTEYTNLSDESVFLSCLTICKFKGSSK